MTAPTGVNNLRPMGIGEILDQSFRVFRRAWKPLLTLGIAGVAPGALISAWMQPQMLNQEPSQSAIFRAIMAATQGDYTGLSLAGGFGLLGMAISLILFPFIQGGVILTSARVIEGEQVSTGEAFRLGKTRYGPLLGITALSILFTIISIPLLVLAGLLVLAVLTVPLGLLALSVYFGFAGHAVVLEELPAGLQPFKRSYRLVKGRFWRTLGLGVVFILLTMVLMWLVGALVGTLVGLGAVAGNSLAFGLVISLLSSLGSAVTTPFALVGMTIAFYDLRIRKEGLDLEMMAKAQVQTPES